MTAALGIAHCRDVLQVTIKCVRMGACEASMTGTRRVCNLLIQTRVCTCMQRTGTSTRQKKLQDLAILSGVATFKLRMGLLNARLSDLHQWQVSLILQRDWLPRAQHSHRLPPNLQHGS